MKIFSFDSESDFLKALSSLDKNLVDDVYTPYPVDIRDMDKTFSWKIVLLIILGFIIAAGFVFYTSHDYIVNVSGKNNFDLAFVLPVLFEFAVLFASLGAFTLFLKHAGLPKFNSKKFDLPIDRADEKFLIALKSCDDELETKMISMKGELIK